MLLVPQVIQVRPEHPARLPTPVLQVPQAYKVPRAHLALLLTLVPRVPRVPLVPRELPAQSQAQQAALVQQVHWELVLPVLHQP